MNRRGLVIARHRREAQIEDDGGKTFSALVRGRKLRPLAGDIVEFHLETDGTPVIDKVSDRESLLERIDSRGQGEGVAANVSLIAVVVAPQPAPDWQLVDRYFVAAALMGIEGLLVRNKHDLTDDPLDKRAETYQEIGYQLCNTSTKTGHELESLSTSLRSHRSVLVGQSGVGKSSLINALLDEDAQAVGDLSQRKSLGRHTTTAAMLYRLPRGGELIDSPGVRRYSPKISNPTELAFGFVEFRPFIGSCRFNNCRHRNEPNCAVRFAVEAGEIKNDRYLSFCALSDVLESFRGS